MMLYGLIGRKLGHSFSARFFNEKFEKEKISARYELFELETIQSLPLLISSHPNICGFNVTIPYKQEVIPFLSTMTDSAREIGAVNTVRVVKCKEPVIVGKKHVILEGHNTDAPGFRDALLPILKQSKNLSHKALILGTGGASKAVGHALKELGIPFQLVSRNSKEGKLTFEQLDETVMVSHDIIINCTPLGMWPDVSAYPPIPYHLINSQHICFDLIYNPEITEFMRRAKSQGAVTSNGLQMLYNQAILAWEFWQKPIKRLFMSRKVEVIKHDGSCETYSLSIVEISYQPDGSIKKVDIMPFSEELPGVEYIDTPLVIHLNDE